MELVPAGVEGVAGLPIAMGDLQTQPVPPRPTLFVRDHTAHVSDQGKRKLYAVDIESGEKVAAVTLPKSTNELSGVAAGR
ncbi:hypothetical protein ACWGIV_21565 [Streptomyces sp. NPDC054844]